MVYKNIIIALCVLGTFLLFANVSGDTMKHKNQKYSSINDVPISAWKELSHKKIYFGHQSVGFNIMAGLEDLIKSHPEIKLNIVESSSPEIFNDAVFAHSHNGENGEAGSKINAFAEKMDKGIGNSADIAFFKFCFVDVNWDSNVEEIFTEYKNEMTMLENKYKKTKFIHFTVPLLVKDKKSTYEKIKGGIKNLFGKPQKDFFDNDNNIARNRFNQMMRNEYRDKEYIFDIAKIESTYDDGRRETFTKDDKEYNALISEYSKDGGHLNESGRKKVAEKLLLFLLDL